MKWPALLLSLCASLFCRAGEGVKNDGAFSERWVFWMGNLATDKSADELVALIARARTAGYTGFLIYDSKFGKLQEMNAHYFKNVTRVKTAASDSNIEIIPEVFPIGYSNDILYNDPDLIEGLPVVDAPFVVKGGLAHFIPNSPSLSKIAFHDDNVTIDGTTWTAEPKGNNSRVSFSLKLTPFRQYHVSVWVKTQDFKGQAEIKALSGSVDLQHSNLGVKPTQDWTELHVTFDSLEQTAITLYFGTWGGRGAIWWKDANIEETALVNLIRRDGAQLRIQDENGRALTEGRDFEELVDPQMGQLPWKGSYDTWHLPPVLKTSLPDGAKLKVSFHFAKTVLDAQAMICPSEPKTLQLLKEHAERVHKTWGAKKYLMGFDEIRLLNWCDCCRKRNLTAGALLAELARQCTQILREVNPGGTIYVWNDMFDPTHNAHKDYYLVHGDLTGSWEGLDKDVVIVDVSEHSKTPTSEHFKSSHIRE